MTESILLGFRRSDIALIFDKLRKIYVDNRRIIQYTLEGYPILNPYPVLKIKNKEVKGVVIQREYFRYLNEIPHNKKILSVDASIKVLFNLGTMRIVEAKVAAGVWQGLNKAKIRGPVKRLTIIEKKEEAAEWLMRIEFEEIMKLSYLISPGDIVILDRSLSIPPLLKKSTRNLVETLDKIVSSKGGILVGLTKSSKLSLNTGESVVGYLINLGEKIYRGLPWFYHPLFREDSLPKWFLGDIVVAKLSELGENAFRIDISRKSLKRYSIEEILGKLSFVQDIAIPGYPYPLKAVHELAKISDNELEVDKMLFLDILKDKSFENDFLSDLKSANFRERYLWGDNISG